MKKNNHNRINITSEIDENNPKVVVYTFLFPAVTSPVHFRTILPFPFHKK